MKTAITFVCILLLSGCTNTIFLKADQDGRKCEARAEGVFTTSMANNRFQQCMNP